MKTPEDEAFEDIERRQGGGFKAKRAAAADKLQEPVAWQWLGSAQFRKKIPKGADKTAWSPLYTAPPKREWVGLTDEDIKEIHNLSFGKDIGIATGLTEAKLKEKNT